MTDVRTVSATHPAPGVLSRIFRTEQDGAPGDGHEQVVFCHDRASGLKAIIAIHSTALGPALGGTRFYPYASEEDALADVLNLSRGMAYKNALAGLDLGGGKAVIIGDPRPADATSPRRCCAPTAASCSRWTAATTPPATSAPTSQDMDVVARECDYVTGRSPENGGAGDSSVLTAFGVFQGMRASAQAPLGRADAARPRVGVAGRRQGRPPPGRPPARRTAPTVVITDVVARPRSTGSGPPTRRSRWSPTPRRC